MNAPKRKPARRRRYRINLIKGTYLYEPSEIAKLFHIHRNTVRHWLKEGLKPIDDRRPVLVHGSDLKAFLARRQEARRRNAPPDSSIVSGVAHPGHRGKTWWMSRRTRKQSRS